MFLLVPIKHEYLSHQCGNLFGLNRICNLNFPKETPILYLNEFFFIKLLYVIVLERMYFIIPFNFCLKYSFIYS